MLTKSSLLKILALLVLLSFTTQAARATGPAADFSLRSIDGQQISSGSLRGKIVVLAFGASWLPLSREQVQGVQKLADEYSGRGVAVFWVSTDSESAKSKNFASDEQLRTFARKNGLRVSVLRDPNAVASKQMGVDQLPAIVILDREGNPVGAPIGGLDPKGNLAGQVASRLNGLL